MYMQVSGWMNVYMSVVLADVRENIEICRSRVTGFCNLPNVSTQN